MASEESEFSNDEGVQNEYKPGAVRVMDETYVNGLEQHRRRSTFCLALVMLALGVAILVFVGGDGGSPSAMSLPASIDGFETTDDVPAGTDTSDGTARHIQFTVTTLDGVEGEEGTFTIEMRPDWAPIGVSRFQELVDSKFYDGARIFRVIDNFISQWGIAEDPLIQAEWDLKPLQDDPVVASNLAGTVTFATAGPNTRTTQVFINLRDNVKLNGQGFAPFGRIVEGLEVIDRFYSEYGEGAPKGNGPNQGKMKEHGGGYVDKKFPKLTYIKNAH